MTLHVYVCAYLYLDRPNHVVIGQMSYHSIKVILWSAKAPRLGKNFHVRCYVHAVHVIHHLLF